MLTPDNTSRSGFTVWLLVSQSRCLSDVVMSAVLRSPRSVRCPRFSLGAGCPLLSCGRRRPISAPSAADLARRRQECGNVPLWIAVLSADMATNMPLTCRSQTGYTPFTLPLVVTFLSAPPLFIGSGDPAVPILSLRYLLSCSCSEWFSIPMFLMIILWFRLSLVICHLGIFLAGLSFQSRCILLASFISVFLYS